MEISMRFVYILNAKIMSFAASNFVEENPQCNYCTESTCSETEDWVVIGNKYQSRDGNARDDDQNYETQRVMCVFEQYIYLSSMTFNLPGNSATSQCMYITLSTTHKFLIQYATV